MYGHVRIYYTGVDEHQCWSRLHIRYHTGDLFNILLLSRVNGPTITECERVTGVSKVCLGYIGKNVYSVFWGINVIIMYRFYIRLCHVIISSLQQLPHPQHHPLM